MKIKTKQKLNLPELIQHIMDNEELRGLYYASTPLMGGVTVSKSGQVLVENVWADDTFTVEVCEELTKHYEFPKILEITDKNSSIENLNMSIHEAISPVSSEFYIMKDGKLHLIWTREHGIPESGVLEVDDE